MKAGVVGGLIGGASGFLAFAAGSVTSTGLTAVLERMGRHAFVNMWMSGIQGNFENMWSAALTGAASSVGGSAISSLQTENVALLTASNSIVGGTVSVIGGGKFANGAVTGAFTMLFNELHGKIQQARNHNRIGFVPLDKDVGFQSANYRAEIRVDGDQNQITVFAGSSNTTVADGEVTFTAKASILVDGQIKQTKPLVNGYAKFNLPSSRNVTLQVEGSWVVNYDYGGAAVPVFHPVFWPFSLNFTDTFKLK
jgi:hypothetical protein